MAKGKYARRTDNQEVIDLRKELENANHRIKTLNLALGLSQDTLKMERLNCNAEVVRRADELAATEIALAKAATREAQDEVRRVKENMAEWLANYFHDMNDALPSGTAYLPRNVMDLFSYLVGQGKVGHYLAIFMSDRAKWDLTRRERRAGADERTAHRAMDGRQEGERYRKLLMGLNDPVDGTQRYSREEIEEMATRLQEKTFSLAHQPPAFWE